MKTNELVAILENSIANAFRLDKKGRKLLTVGFALLGTTIGVSVLQLAVMLLYGIDLHLWWKAMIPWAPIAVWAYWRFLLRYFHTEAFVCDHCGRLKCYKARSPKYFGRTKACLKCEERRAGLEKQLGDINRGLDKLREEIGFVSKHQ